MKKILILQNILPHYRRPFYNHLARDYEVTVLHSGNSAARPEDLFSEIVVPMLRLGPLRLQRGVLKQVRSKRFDAVIAMFDVNWVMNVASYLLRPRSLGFVWWGIGAGKSRWANALKCKLVGAGVQAVLYNAEGRRKMVELGVPSDRIKVGNNTFHVSNRERCHDYPEKDLILFVGTLMGRKQCDVLINAFADVANEIPQSIRLAFVGAGVEEFRLRQLAHQRGIKDRVCFEGAIDDSVSLASYYRRALVSVSFGQAGLSVLQSLAFGVPFITKYGAISGGEIYNIVDGHNGILCEDDPGKLAEYLRRFCQNSEWARELGKNAYDYYSKYCTLDVMALGFREAIEITTAGKM